MKLIELGRLRWQVLAVVDHRDRCNVLAVLSRLQGHAGKKMLRTLRSRIPEHGPAFHNPEKAKQLDDGIWELREQPKHGPKPRVFFFRDGNQPVIVTTEATAKRDDDLSGFIASAKRIRTRYEQDRDLGLNEIEQIELNEEDEE